MATTLRASRAALPLVVTLIAVGCGRNVPAAGYPNDVISTPSAGKAAATAAALTVSPRHGAVGTTVTLAGASCNNPGQPTYLAFEGMYPTDGMIGAFDIPNIPVGSAQQFKTAFVIPVTFHSLQGRGGGTVRPGHYEFVSYPVICQAEFTVDSVSLPRAGARPVG